MALIPIFKIWNIVTYNQLIRSQLRLLWFVHTHNVNKNKQRYYRIKHAGHKSKSGQPVRLYSISGTLLLLFFQQTCQNIAIISSISLVHLMHEWGIPQDNRIVQQIWRDKNNWKTASIFQIMRKCCILISKLLNIRIKNTFKKFRYVGVYL